MRAGTGATGAVVAVLLLLVAKDALGDQDPSKPHLKILPGTYQVVPIGKTLLLTCRPVVNNIGLISNLEWIDNSNNTIKVINGTSEAMHAETMENGVLGLVIPVLTESMAGVYHCVGMYSNNQRLYANITIVAIVPITWKDAPEFQYPIKGRDYQVKCDVIARPPPSVTWMRNKVDLKVPNDKYIIETTGLLIKNVQDSDDGGYMCKAAVYETGELKIRNIQLEVHTIPVIQNFSKTIEVLEGESASIPCTAIGKPPPSYEWIKNSNKENLDRADRFSVDRHTGLLTLRKVDIVDTGTFTCTAKNSAGIHEKTIHVEVIVKPDIYEYVNITLEYKKDAEIICKSKGRPAPQISFKKVGSPDYFTNGLQKDDERISVEQSVNTNTFETTAKLSITNLKRSDDGLYECMAENRGGKAYKNGHITVEFPPTFENTMPTRGIPTWSWNKRPVNLTCIAESIPNATIEWRLRDKPLEEDRLIRIYGRGPVSYLNIRPEDDRLYTHYKCVASNRLGIVETDVELRLADRPQAMQQAKVGHVTATSITFELVGPPDNGFPLQSIVVQYLPDMEPDWNRAKNKTWSINSPYTVENLQPLYTYIFRFAARNEVGLANFGSAIKYTMPNRAPPQAPEILQGELHEDETIHSPYADHYEIRWKIPADNGETIDIYEIKYCPTSKRNGVWIIENEKECVERNEKAYENTAYEMNKLSPDTYYYITLRAHNRIGFSTPAELRVKTAIGNEMLRHEQPALSSASIIGIVIAGVVVMLFVVDLLLCCCRRQGVIATLCYKKAKQHEEDQDKLGSLYGWRFPLPYCSNKEPPAPPSPAPLPPPVKLASTPTDEKEPLNNDRIIIDNSMMRNTSVEFDGRKVHAKTGEIIGKNSAV